MTTTTATTVRVLIALDVPVEQATDRDDLIYSVHARLADEAGYLDNGDPIMPAALLVTVVDDETLLTQADLRGIYEVGVEGVGG